MGRRPLVSQKMLTAWDTYLSRHPEDANVLGAARRFTLDHLVELTAIAPDKEVSDWATYFSHRARYNPAVRVVDDKDDKDDLRFKGRTALRPTEEFPYIVMWRDGGVQLEYFHEGEAAQERVLQLITEGVALCHITIYKAMKQSVVLEWESDDARENAI